MFYHELKSCSFSLILTLIDETSHWFEDEQRQENLQETPRYQVVSLNFSDQWIYHMYEYDDNSHLILSWQDRFSMQKFCKDATDGPHINSWPILRGSKQQLWGSVIKSLWSWTTLTWITTYIWLARWEHASNELISGVHRLIVYLYHKVMTRFVRFPLWSLENDRARPKSASFRFPSLSMRRFDPAWRELFSIQQERINKLPWKKSTAFNFSGNL